MNKKTISKWNRVLHRDLGYLFSGMLLLYAISGIALNHSEDWDPSFVVELRELEYPNLDKPTEDEVIAWLETENITNRYKKHYYTEDGVLRVLMRRASIDIKPSTQKAILEELVHRPFFFQVNYLHYNPGRAWTYFSDFFAVVLIFITIGGLFMARGKYGFVKRGVWLVLVGCVIPVVFYFIY